MKGKSIAAILIFSFILSGCQNNNVITFTDATSIEVYEWDSEVWIATIEDEEFVGALEDELDHAETFGTGTVDWAGPEYRLLFKHGDKELHEIGYSTTLLNFEIGGVGRYWKAEKLYAVETELPLELAFPGGPTIFVIR